jgi:hypothetical protein
VSGGVGGGVSASKGEGTVEAEAAVREASATGKSRQAIKEALEESHMQRELKGYLKKVTYADVC